MSDRPATDPAFLVNIAGTAYARGMRYVYVSNMADRLRELSHTRCPACHEVVIRRFNYATEEVRLREGACPACSSPIPGLWSAADRASGAGAADRASGAGAADRASGAGGRP